MTELSAAVVAEDLRSLAEFGGLDAATVAVLGRAADLVESAPAVHCPDCPGWSIAGLGAEDALINHWALVHMRRVSWEGPDVGPTIWPVPAVARAEEDA